MWSTVTWTVARAGGLTALLLLTLAVASGLAMSLRWQSAQKWPRLINNELHNFLTLLATIFVAVHVLAVWLDPYTKFSWNEILIPFISTYRPIYVALGIIGVYLGIAIGISTLLRKYIGYKLWRSLHVFTLLIYALAVVHGIFSGSDTTSWWGISIYVACLLLIGTFVSVRMSKLGSSNQKKTPVATSRTVGPQYRAPQTIRTSPLPRAVEQ